MKIKKIHATEILDSRGFPTVAAFVETESGIRAKAIAPSGASKGRYEAREKRDCGKRYLGKGVMTAVKNVNTEIMSLLLGMDIREQNRIDMRLRSLYEVSEGEIGANATIAVSEACAKAGAKATSFPLYRYLAGAKPVRIPTPMMNVINGGQHAQNNLDIQEFMIVPEHTRETCEAIRMCAEIYHALKEILKDTKHVSSVGDEGGFAPDLRNDEEALVMLMKAAERAKYEPGKDVFFALDAAASGWYENGRYRLTKSGREFEKEELIGYYEELCGRYPVISIEDGMAEEDYDGFKAMNRKLGKKIMIVGDDLFVTDQKRILSDKTKDCANCVLLKPNQTGTVTGAIEAANAAFERGMRLIASHRSGDSEDAFITDFAVGVGSGYLKAGAPARSERTSKYNRLIEIAGGI